MARSREARGLESVEGDRKETTRAAQATRVGMVTSQTYGSVVESTVADRLSLISKV